MNKIILAVMLTIFSVTSANAASSRANTVSSDEFYMGVGLGSNSASGWDDASGYQIFGGYNLSVKGWNAQHSVEFGYMDSGDFEYSILGLNPADPFGPPIEYKFKESAEGLWVTYTVNRPLSDSVNFIARGGLDFGDDDGLILGLGFEFDFDAAVKLRTEFVQRDNIDSLQLNIVFEL